MAKNLEKATDNQKVSTALVNLAEKFGMMPDLYDPAIEEYSELPNKQYDGVLGMYHDQGLTPFKILSKNQGVNFTAGLPIIRTSPDHGTAFDIAGKNKASFISFKNAMLLAKRIYLNRSKD